MSVADVRRIVDEAPKFQPPPEQKAKKANGSHDARPKFEPVAFNARELLDVQFAPQRWLLQGLIPEGTVLLAGKPKSGKSWLALNLLVSCALALVFLRRDPTACGGLYLALEDNARRMKKRLLTLLRDYPDKEDMLKRLEYRCDWPAGTEGAQALDAYLTAHADCRVVCVDVLKKIRPRADARRNAYDLDYEAIDPWKRVAEKHGVTLVIVHHSRKADAEDVFDEISGTLGLSGAVDQMIVLRRAPADAKKATLHARGRDLEEDVELAIELKGGWWEYLGSAAKLAANEARQQILDLLAEARETEETAGRQGRQGMTAAEILKATGKRSRTSLLKLMGNMMKDGLITREKTRYLLSSSNE